MERAGIFVESGDLSPAKLRDFFAEVFASMDERPRPLLLTIDAPDAYAIDLEDGEPVFYVGGQSERACFRRRWLAEHPVPLKAHGRRRALVLEPTTGNRVRVRLPTPLEAILNFLFLKVRGS